LILSRRREKPVSVPHRKKIDDELVRELPNTAQNANRVLAKCESELDRFDEGTVVSRYDLLAYAP
jgi:hypothetical protein